jgi:hypothetical protein
VTPAPAARWPASRCAQMRAFSLKARWPARLLYPLLIVFSVATICVLNPSSGPRPKPLDDILSPGELA